MKKCSSCGLDKEDIEYAFRNKSKNIRQPQCNVCRKKTAKASYNKNRVAVIMATRNRTKEFRKEFKKYKSTLKCEQCGESESCCLDFHHRDPLQKKFIISDQVASSTSMNRLLKEINKCVVLCSNCHRKVHAGVIKL